MRFLKLFLIGLFSTFLLLSGLYVLHPGTKRIIDRKLEWVFPCRKPITYSLGTFDKKFGISEDDFLEAIEVGKKVWENELGKTLFAYTSEGGDIVINLVYDERQSSTDELKKIGYVIKDNKSTYEDLKASYEARKLDYTKKKELFEVQRSNLEKQKSTYETMVKNTSSKGKVTVAEYDSLSKKRESINATVEKLNRDQDTLNADAQIINSLATTINTLISKLNLDVEKFNTTRVSLQDEFDEGIYNEDGTERSITIYQFETKQKLERVLAHELGHALSIDHNNNPLSIMYAINQSDTLTLSKDDMQSLFTACDIQK